MHPLRRFIRTVLFLPIQEAEEREEHVLATEGRVQHAERCFHAANHRLSQTRESMDDLMDQTLRKTLGRSD